MVVGALFVLTACSGGGSSGVESSASVAAPNPTTTSTVATTTTVPPPDSVRVAWTAYWAMIDRLLARPDPNDPELAKRVGDPLLSDLRDDLARRMEAGRVVVPGPAYGRTLDQIEISGTEASVRGCEHDDSVTYGPQGETLSKSRATRILVGSFTLDGSAWQATDIGVVSEEPGIIACAV
jgi:hypothetical protein